MNTTTLLAGEHHPGAITADGVCPLSCPLMIPAMSVAMLLRLDVYATRDPVRTRVQ